MKQFVIGRELRGALRVYKHLDSHISTAFSPLLPPYIYLLTSVYSCPTFLNVSQSSTMSIRYCNGYHITKNKEEFRNIDASSQGGYRRTCTEYRRFQQVKQASSNRKLVILIVKRDARGHAVYFKSSIRILYAVRPEPENPREREDHYRTCNRLIRGRKGRDGLIIYLHFVLSAYTFTTYFYYVPLLRASTTCLHRVPPLHTSVTCLRCIPLCLRYVP